MNEEIRRRLREAAEAHEPNRARILARVERGAADPNVRHRTPSIARSWPRAAIVGLIAAATLATGGLAAAVAAIGGAPTPPATAPTHTVPSPTVTSAPTPSARTTSTGPAPATTSGSARPTPPAGSRVNDGPLWSEGSLDAHSTIYWAQNNLILKTTKPLTSLTVELRIAQTGDVRSTGNWQTLPSDDFTVTVQESGGALLYRWALKPGRTVPAGQHQFAGQYNHATGVRKVKRDSYHVHAESSGRSVAVWGGFAPPR
ncbi:hypothetical protein EV646_111235 [Kribbella antiqua]|uniref:Uncharacterized protein n=1 Tax=Kribbella antiqua TaxID=2512217 RepID=A0A4R2IGZ1_9ACTN|nr:hypothetical protein [Kribbella antiqua]TCO44043.1 hypothetical protein EV646_111235 [Kribbella antiqua]